MIQETRTRSLWLTCVSAAVVGLLWLPVVAGVTTGQVSAASETANKTVASVSPNVAEVIIVFKTHFDIGFTDLARNVVHRYRTSMIDQALEVYDRNRDLPPEQRFVWTIPGWPMAKILEQWEGQTAERQRRVREAFKEGQLVVHALPYTTHTESLELEDLVRGLGFATNVSRSAGLNLPHDAKMTDVPCHTWALPTILKHAGVDFLHIGSNNSSAAPETPLLFLWEGPDGSQLLTMRSRGYGTRLDVPDNWPYKTWLALIHTSDNQGPPSPEHVKRVIEEAKHKLPGAKIRIGRLSGFGDAILRETAELPVVRADMPDVWIHGLMASPMGYKVARNTRPMIALAESLNTLLRGWGVDVPGVGNEIAAAYEKSLMYGEHTWGGSFAWIGRRLLYDQAWQDALARDLDEGHKRLEESWDEHRSYIDKARAWVMPVIQRDLKALAAAVNVEGKRIVVFNPLPWRRDGLVTERIKDEVGAMKEIDTGRLLNVDRQGDVIRFMARDVPAMGFQTYVPVADAGSGHTQDADENSVLENAFFKATLDPARGAVRSLIDKRTGRELVNASAKYGLGQYLYERFDADRVDKYVHDFVYVWTKFFPTVVTKPDMPPASEVPYAAASPKGFSIRIVRGSVTTTAVMEAPASDDVPHGVTFKLTLYEDRPVFDLELGITDKRPDTWPEAGWICLPFKIDDPVFRLGRLASIIDPVTDTLRGSNRDMFCLNSGMTVTEPQGAGVGICPLDAPLISIETPGCWKFSRDFAPRKSDVFINLFNNQWTTNFRIWNEGSWTSRVRLWVIDAYDAEKSLLTPSQETRCPLRSAMANESAGTLPVSLSGLELSRRGVLVTAFGPNPDGNGIVLRLWEHAGKDGPCRVRLPRQMKIKTAQPCDLRGRRQGEPIPVGDDAQIDVKLKHFAPVTLILE